jgi:hypothetical protein
MKKLTFLLVVLLVVLNVNAQNTDKKSRKEMKAEKAAQQKELIKKIIESKSYKFIAEQAVPSRGRSISITRYNVEFKGDTVISYLPYYGRAYTANIGSSSSPYDFTAVAEDYTESETKKGYKVEFRIRQGAESISYNFEIFPGGSATLIVTSSSRQPITYYGRIE